MSRASTTSGSATAPIFLIGAPRSGTSLLYKTLALHPEAGYLSNYVERVPRQPWLAALNRIPPRVPEARRRVWFGDDGNAYVYNGKRSLWRKALPMPTEGESLFARCGIPEAPTPHDAPVEAQQRLLRESFERIRRASGARHVLCKRIANNLRLPLLAGAFPQARFVLLTRDGRAVASSLRQVNWWPDFWVFWYGSTPTRWEADGGDPWELAARHWVEELEAIDAGLPAIAKEHLLCVSYEEFVADPVDGLRQIAEFAGLGDDASWRRELGRLSYPDQNERWRTKLAPEAIATIEQIQRPQLEKHGYVPPLCLA